MDWSQTRRTDSESCMMPRWGERVVALWFAVLYENDGECWMVSDIGVGGCRERGARKKKIRGK